MHDFPTAEAFARHLRQSALANYGTPIRAFLKAVASDQDSICEEVFDYIRRFVTVYVPTGADGQVQRVAQRFALIAAAGELAVAVGAITCWSDGDATAAAAKCFSDWLAARGGIEPAEVRDGIEQVRAFLLAHGDARFVDWGEDESRIPVRDVVGFRKKTDTGVEFFINASAWRDEICAGRDGSMIAKAMVERGHIEPGSNGRASTTIKPPGRSKLRVYHVRAAFLDEDGHG